MPTPPLPPGFKLDTETPPLPPGFTLDTQAPRPGLSEVAMKAAKSVPLLGAYLKLPEQIKNTVLGGERALLTNEPTQGMAESVLRGVPAAVGGALGGTVGLVAGAPLTVGAVGTSAGGAALGGAAGEAARQAAAQVYSGVTGRGKVQSAGGVIKDVATQAAIQVPGQIANLGTGLIAKYGVQRLPSILAKFGSVPEPITKYVQGRGSKAVFTKPNLTEGAALENVGEATANLEANRAAVGSQIGPAENKVLEKVGNKTPAIRHIREGLESALAGRGITDPKTAGLARGKEVNLLKKLVDVLTPTESGATTVAADGITRVPVTEKLTLSQAINAKRLIDDNLDFAGKELSTATQQLLKKVNGQIRDSVRADLGPNVGKLWDDYSVIKDAQKKLQEFTGTQTRSSVQQRAVQSLRGIMLKNPKEVDNIVTILGAGLPGGEAQARNIFDSIAAEMFTKSGPGAPSNIILKGAATVGLSGGPMARGLVRGSEALNKIAAGPAKYSRGIGPAINALLGLREQK